jgi:hypothetical protein
LRRELTGLAGTRKLAPVLWPRGGGPATISFSVSPRLTGGGRSRGLTLPAEAA